MKCVLGDWRGRLGYRSGSSSSGLHDALQQGAISLYDSGRLGATFRGHWHDDDTQLQRVDCERSVGGQWEICLHSTPPWRGERGLHIHVFVPCCALADDFVIFFRVFLPC
jgi:hypothetical protein